MPLNFETPPTRSASDDFKLTVRQQPVRARMCGFGEKDRRTIDPPPIVELHELKGPLPPAERDRLVLQCTLWNEEGTEERGTIREVVGKTSGLGTAEELPVHVEQKHAKNMMGENFASINEYDDEHGTPCLFFVFSDLSVRAEGRYRLKMDLLQIELPGNGLPQRPGRIVAECLSHVFSVFQAKKFPGMMDSTPLTDALSSQGCTIKTRNKEKREKEKEKKKKDSGKPPTSRTREKRPATASSSEEEETIESPESSESKRKRSRER